MEALGAVVTVAQLTDYIVTIIFSIRKAYSRFRFRTERLRHQLQQLERLTIVINTIDNNNSLRGSTISDQSHICEPLKAVAVTVEQIQETLVTEQQRRKERFLVRALNIRLNEVKQNRLKYLFKQLEFDQRTLLLGISDSHMDIVWRIWQLFSNMCTPAPNNTNSRTGSAANDGSGYGWWSADATREEPCKDLVKRSTQDLDSSSQRSMHDSSSFGADPGPSGYAGNGSMPAGDGYGGFRQGDQHSSSRPREGFADRYESLNHRGRGNSYHHMGPVGCEPTTRSEYVYRDGDIDGNAEAVFGAHATHRPPPSTNNPSFYAAHDNRPTTGGYDSESRGDSREGGRNSASAGNAR